VRLLYQTIFICREQDLLGEYEFNPFVDVDVELDYDENMEEPSTLENSQEEKQTKNEEGTQIIIFE